MPSQTAATLRAQLRVRSRVQGLLHDRQYRQTLDQATTRRIVAERTGPFAVVVHAFNLDVWERIAERLQHLPDGSFQLFLTAPGDQTAALERSLVARGLDGRVLTVPNRGRDVLPFVQVANTLSHAGYESVLKLHTKRSAHHAQGDAWMDSMLAALLPRETDVICSALDHLGRADSGVIGPAGLYFPLRIRLAENRRHLNSYLSRRYGPQTAQLVLDERPDDYGYFAGTMFYARLDAISDLLHVRPATFERELGQYDATVAHALERLFCLVPALEGRRTYEMDSRGVHPRAARAGKIPAWAERLR